MGDHAGQTLVGVDEDAAVTVQAVAVDTVDAIEMEFLVEDVSIDGMCGVY